MRYRRYRKKIKMDFKRWMKYSFTDQEKILSKYNVILLGHRTTKEKLKALFKRSNEGKRKERRDKIKKTIRKIIKGIEYFSKEVNKFSLDEKQTDKNIGRLSNGLRELSMGSSANRFEGLVSSKRDYSGLVGSSKGDYSSLSSSKRDYSALIG